MVIGLSSAHPQILGKRKLRRLHIVALHLTTAQLTTTNALKKLTEALKKGTATTLILYEAENLCGDFLLNRITKLNDMVFG